MRALKTSSPGIPYGQLASFHPALDSPVATSERYRERYTRSQRICRFGIFEADGHGVASAAIISDNFLEMLMIARVLFEVASQVLPWTFALNGFYAGGAEDRAKEMF